MRDAHVTTKERDEEAIKEACELLRPLTKPALSWSIVHWNDPPASNDPRDEFETAVEFVIALLDPAVPTSSAQAETYDSQAQLAADEFLGVHASIVRKAAKQPPDAAASYHHEQNRQCDCSRKHCNDCCERKDVHNAIRKCEKHAFPLDGKRPQPPLLAGAGWQSGVRS